MVLPGGLRSQRFWERHRGAAYASAFVAVSFVWLGRAALEPVLNGTAPLLAFALAVSISAYLGGLGPGLVATALSVATGMHFFLAQISNLSGQVHLALFVAVCGGISVAADRLQRVNQRIRESEERFRLLVEGAHATAIFALGPDGRITSWNPGAARLLGYTAEDMVGQHTSVLYTGEERGRGEPEEALKRAAALGSYQVEGWRIRKDGSRYWADVSITALRHEDGELRGFSKIIRDLTESKAVEDALRESEAATRALMESAAQGIIGVDPQGRIVLANAMAQVLFGYSRQELLRQSIDMLLPESLRERHATQREGYMKNPHTRPMGSGLALRARRKDGSEFPVEISLSTFQTQQQSVAVSFITDISNRRAAEQEREKLIRELAEERSRLRAVVDQMPVGVIIGEAPDGRRTLHNREAERVLSHEVMIPDPNLPFGFEHEDGRRFQLEEYPLIRALRTGEVLQNQELIYRRGTSDVTTLSLSAAPIRDSTGTIVAGVVTFTDISERKRAELERERLLRENAENRALLDSVLDNAPIGLGVYDRNLRLVRLNEALAGINGSPKETYVGRRMTEVFPGIGRQTIEPLRSVIESGKPVLNQEVKAATPVLPGKMRFWLASYFPVKFGDDVVYCGMVIHEITERKESERTLRELNRILERANEDLRQFAYAASHDLAEPLRMVTTYTQLLERRYSAVLDDNARQYISYAVDGARRIEDLLRALRDYWQVSELTPAAPRWIDPGDVLDRTLKNLGAMICQTNAVITRDPMPAVLANETPLLQLFQNLIGNALKYIHPARPPAIHVRVTIENEEWVFSIRDNGIGIDPRYARQVFGIFKRLHGYRYPGTGMGLPICEKIVERLGGRIWVDSELDAGANFQFTIPIPDAHFEP
jgi:PAS domain S-box-containing protein